MSRQKIPLRTLDGPPLTLGNRTRDCLGRRTPPSSRPTNVFSHKSLMNYAASRNKTSDFFLLRRPCMLAGLSGGVGVVGGADCSPVTHAGGLHCGHF